MFSTEQNQDEVPVDIGPTSVRDLYRISPREDLTSGEFGFVEGNTGSKSASNIDIIDVYDFGIDRKEEKLALADYLDTLPPHRTPLSGVYLANMAHVYPQDRGQNYSLRLGERMAQTLLSDRAS